MGERPNSHGRTLTDKSYVLHGIPYETALGHIVENQCFPYEIFVFQKMMMEGLDVPCSWMIGIAIPKKNAGNMPASFMSREHP
jgi:hypothetical protein